MKLRPAMLTIAFALAAVLLGGCGSMSLPKFPHPIGTPSAEVAAVRLVDSSDVAGRYLIYITLSNPNDVPLPIEVSDYKLSLGGQSYQGDTPPQATIPASGTVTVSLPAVIAGGGAGGKYDVSGSLAVHPPGQIKQILYDMGVPYPRASFSGTGTTESNSTPPPGAPPVADTKKITTAPAPAPK